jgi:2-polyprenyl-3-methyl-5-hydroxy-6-metoxy-1,4-benzoquinol methylase
MSTDKAGKHLWDNIWADRQLAGAVDPCAKGLNHYVDRKFHSFFQQTFAGMDTDSKTILEIGCAGSQWLPYFAKQFGFKVSGIDYSELGCRQAREILTNEGVEGDVVCSDFFSPPEEMLGKFDVVVSFGVVEHFDDTAECLERLSRFLKPGGLMITSIPNMTGMIGYVLKRVNRRFFDIHVPLDDLALALHHRKGGLQVLSCEYFLFVNWNVIRIDNWDNRVWQEIGVRLRSWVSKGTWCIESLLPVLKPNRLTSPYINCVAAKPLR